MAGDDENAELETFRKQWQEEVSARAKAASSSSSSSKKPGIILSDSSQGGVNEKEKEKEKKEYTRPPPKVHSVQGDLEKKDEQFVDAGANHGLDQKDDTRRLWLGDRFDKGTTTHGDKEEHGEPSSALEHYEQAVEREAQGNLGDSLKLYRKAYRLDAGVDRLYKNKHFPPVTTTASRPIDPNPSNAPVTVPNTAHHSLDGLPDLIASFSSSLSIHPAPPPTDEAPPPPCPISSLPPEILTHILEYCAVADVASLAHLAVVCKRLAYLVTTEDQLWKVICLASDYGFTAMHYTWNCTVSGKPLLPDEQLPLDLRSPVEPSHIHNPSLSHSLGFFTIKPSLEAIHAFPLSRTYPNYRSMLRTRPRVRFNGCYISTVNYIRPGASSTSQISWNTPVHIVTYYRYLRFFRDGSCVSLLTTVEPADVVHHIRKENIPSQSNGGAAPAAVMKHALRGRWKLTGPDPLPLTNGATNQNEPEGAIHIETEGVDPDKYVYKMHLGFRSAGRAGVPRNNKLVWKGFWSYNRLTDDWAEFGLRNDRAFFWSRIVSYGMGE